MATRADINNFKRPEYYSDFSTAFVMTPAGKSLARVTDEESVKQSLRNLILTDQGERLFQSNVGGNVRRSLFDLADSPFNFSLKLTIQKCIEYYEIRAFNVQISVNTPFDSSELIVEIVFNIINNPEPINLLITLQRVR